MNNMIKKILEERKKTHGDFTDHASVTQDLKRSMQIKNGWDRLTSPQRECLDMIAHKIGRILAGNPNERDHWHDIAGYATLVADRCPEPKATAQGRADELHRMGVADLPIIQAGLTQDDKNRLAELRAVNPPITTNGDLYCTMCDDNVRVNAAGYCLCGKQGCPNVGKKVL